jgi:hypothetical protein
LEDQMKKLIAAALAIGVVAGTATVAEARDGCGRGAYRGPYGHCRPIGPGGAVVVVPRGPVIGTFYPGRGYWDGRRYYAHRYRHHGGWRYR